MIQYCARPRGNMLDLRPNFESCVWRDVSSHSSHHPQEVLLAQFSLYVHKGGLKPHSFHFILALECTRWRLILIVNPTRPSHEGGGGVRKFKKSQCGNKLRFFKLSAVQKWNESGFRPPLCTYRLNWARRTSWWLRWHCPPDTGFEIQALAVWGRERYLSVTEAPRNTDFHTWMGKKHFFVSFKPPRPGTEPRALAWKAAVLTTTLEPPPIGCAKVVDLFSIL